MKNKKGFTLVELLAVIVILALIMSIAIISIGGVLDGAKTSTFKETAASIVDGVKKQLLINNRLEAGDYKFSKEILDKGGSESPFGGTLNIPATLTTTSGCTSSDGSLIATGICKLTASDTTCSATSVSFVRIASDKTASICLNAGSGNKWIDVTVATEAALLGSGSDMIKG